MKFQLKGYNEFRHHIRWHDYISIIVHEFPVLLIRKYDWPDDFSKELDYTLVVGILGFRFIHRGRHENSP